MSQIEVKKIIKALNASDGAGVKLKRSIGTPEADSVSYTHLTLPTILLV